MDYVIMFFVALCAGCGPYADPRAPDGNLECGTQKLGVLMGLYASELDFACRPFNSIEECKGSQRDEVEKKYEKLFAEWRDCE